MPPEDTTNNASVVPSEGNLPASEAVATTPVVEAAPEEMMPEAAVATPEVAAEAPAPEVTPTA